MFVLVSVSTGCLYVAWPGHLNEKCQAIVTKQNAD